MAEPRTPSASPSEEAWKLAAEFITALDHATLEDPTAALALLIQGVKDGARSEWLVSARAEDLEVAEDALRIEGRHPEANRLMGFRRTEPLLRELALIRDRQSRIYVENGKSYKTRNKDKKKDIDTLFSDVNRTSAELNDIAWELYGTYVAPWQRDRADQIGKSHDYPTVPSPEYVDAF